jgi:hypothetical protein
MRALAAVILATVLEISASHTALPAPPNPIHYIAHRYDDARVVFSLERTFQNEPELRRRSLAQNPTRLPDPAGRLAWMTLWKMGESFWERHLKDLPGPVPGDRWGLEAGGLATYHCTIEELAVAEVECGTAIVAIAQVNPAEQEAFKRVSEKHYLVVSEANHVAVPSSQVGPAILKVLPALSAGAVERLEAGLQEQFQRELPKVRKASAASYALMAQLGRQHPWQVRDERLERGEGKLSYDLQAFRLTPDGQPRYYVRAQWTLDRDIAFLMSAWARPDRDMLLEAVSTRPSRWQRMNEFQSERLGLDDLGVILNVFDYDGDGWGEVLIGQRLYEGFHIHLLEYSEGQGFRRTGIVYRYGC